VGGAIAEAERRAAVDNRVFLPRQFTNPLNSQAHEVGTGRELIEQLDGRIDAFVAGVGTGGTLAGVGAALRAAGIDALVVEARPTTNAGEPCRVCGGIPGIVPGMSGLLDADEADRTIAVTEAEAVGAARRLCAMGLPVGLSSGLNVVAAAALVAELPPGSRVATVLPDRMERYFSAELFDDLVMA
jgi:cysteine synthase A